MDNPIPYSNYYKCFLFLPNLPSFQKAFDTFVSMIPFVGRSLSLHHHYMLFNSLHQLSQSHYTFDQSLEMTLKENHPLSSLIEEIHKKLLKGIPASQSLSNVKGFPHYIVSYLKIAEEKNAFPKSLNKISLLLERDLSKSLKQLQNIYHSFFILLTGALICWLFISFIAPMLNPNTFFNS